MIGKNQDGSGSWIKKFVIMYFERLIRINHQTENSLLFITSVEIFRFLLGHTLVFLVFIVETLDETQQGILYSQLKRHLDFDALQNYQIFRALSICWLGLQIFFILGFFIKEEYQIKFKIVRILYFLMKYSKISCQFMFSIFGLTFFGAIHHKDFVMVIILLLEMLIAIILFKITAIYEQKNIFESHDAYTHNHNLGVEITNLLFCLLTFISTLLFLYQIPEFFRTILILLWTALQLIRLKTTVIFPYYQMQTTHFLYSIGVCLQTSQLIVQVLLHFSKLDMLSSNALWLICILTFFLFEGVKNFNNYLVEKSYFRNIEQLKSQQDFYLLINSYYNALQSLTNQNNLSDICLIVSSIRRDHQNSCKNPNCYCLNDNQLKNFLKSYLYENLSKLESVFSHNHQILLYIYSFKFHVYEQYIKIHHQLQRLDKIKEMGWLQLLLSMALKYKLKKWIDEKNKEHKVIRICLAIRLEEDMSILNDLIIEDIEVRYKKWMSLTKELSRMQEIRNMSNKELMNFIKIEEIKTKKWQDYRQSPIFNLILHFYFRRIALKMDSLVDLQKNIKQLNRKIKQEQLSKISLFSKYLFHHNACTVEVSIRQSNLGTVLNTSKSIYRVFGYSSKRIIGQNVSILIPHFLSKQYLQILNQWIQKGQSIKNISQVSQALCLHKENISFVSIQYYKIYPSIDEITLITTFFLKNDNDLILINEKGALQGFGRGMKPLLYNLPHHIFCDYVFKNLLKKLRNAQVDIEKQSKTIIFNQSTINEFLSGKKTLLNNNSQKTNNSSSGSIKQKKRSQKIQALQRQKQAYLNKSSSQGYNAKISPPPTSNINENKQLQPTEKQIIINQIQTVTTFENNLDANKQTNQFLSEGNVQFENVWKIKFTYKKQLFGSQQFYRLQMKSLQPIKNFEEYLSKNQEGMMEMGSVKGEAGQSDKIVEDDAVQDAGQQENSSLASFTSQLGYGISKLVTYFTFLLLNPKKLEDKRMKKKFLLELLFTLSLASILSATLVINKYSLDEKTTELKAKSFIDRTFHLLEISTNHIFNIYSYRADPEAQKIAISELQWDTRTFDVELNRQFRIMNQEVTSLNGQILYDYLKTATNWTFQRTGLYQCELLTFFKLNLLLFSDIQNSLTNGTRSIEEMKDQYRLLTLNAPQLRIVRQYLTQITEETLAKNDRFNTTYLIISLVLFFIFSAAFGLYVNNYRKFRFDQNQDHIQLYQMIPSDVLKQLGDYYAAYYKHYVVGKLRIDSSLDEEKKLFQLEIQENAQTQQMSVNKVKLVGRRKYWQWIAIIILFLLLNGGNIIISYNMYLFNKQVAFFSKLTNYISSSESILLSRWIRLKSQYYFNNDQFTTAYLDFILSYLDAQDVKFGTYATFQQNWVTQSDSNFREEFNLLLTSNPCQLNMDLYKQEQLKICNQQAILSKNGLITFVNGFSRTLMNLVLQWKKDFDQIKKHPDYIASLKQFRQYDMALSFHLSTFNKLNNKITQVYENGFNTEYQSYLIIFVLLIILLTVSFLFSLYISCQDRILLSYLYGYVLLFPAFALKQSKYLLKFIQTNLEFSEKH